jgi:hypothetical protein
MESKRTVHRTDDIKSLLFEKISKIDKSLAKLTKRKGDKTQINKIRDKWINKMLYIYEFH